MTDPDNLDSLAEYVSTPSPLVWDDLEALAYGPPLPCPGKCLPGCLCPEGR